MTTKEKIKKGVVKIVTESKDIRNDIILFVKDEYEKTIELKGDTADTIKEITKDTLDGMLEGISEVKNKGLEYANKLKKDRNEIKDLMKVSAEAMIDVARQAGENTLVTSKESAEKSKQFFDEALDKVQHSIDDIEDYAKEQIEIAFHELRETKIETKNKLEAIGDALNDYADEKKNETAKGISNALHKTADKSKDAAIDFTNSVKSYSKKLTNHSLRKVSDWLKNLSNKVNS